MGSPQILRSGSLHHAFWLFLCLQALDVITTLTGLQLGASEGSVFIGRLMQTGPLPGLLLSKMLAVVLIVTALAVERTRLLHRVNIWCAALVTWNLLVIFTQALLA